MNTNRNALPDTSGRRPWWLFGGLALIAICWPLGWLLPGPRTHLLFFPLWLGYILTFDGVVALRSGSSILIRSRWRFPLLFLASVPVWWIFELLNLRLDNWRYVGRELFTDLEYGVLASVAFSTVIPAVLETADLWRTFRWTDRLASGRRIAARPALALRWFGAGLVMLALLLLFPRFAFPLTWLSLLFLIDPLAWALHRGSLLGHLSRGDWRPLLIAPLGALTCGFFWEMWNWFSYPYWIYQIPFFDFARLFQMPALGYLGYLPFGLEIVSVAYLLLGPSLDLMLEWDPGDPEYTGAELR